MIANVAITESATEEMMQTLSRAKSDAMESLKAVEDEVSRLEKNLYIARGQQKSLSSKVEGFEAILEALRRGRASL